MAQLLPHEDPASHQLDDVELWIGVYRELLRALQDMNDTAENVGPGDAEAMAEVTGRYRARLAFWENRRTHCLRRT